MHAWINLSHPGFSGRTDMPEDSDEWISWEEMARIVREHNERMAREEQEIQPPEIPMGTALQRLGLRLSRILDGDEFTVLEREFLNPAIEELSQATKAMCSAADFLDEYASRVPGISAVIETLQSYSKPGQVAPTSPKWIFHDGAGNEVHAPTEMPEITEVVHGNIPESEANQWVLHESGAAFYLEPGEQLQRTT